jgi:hypothetical protein
LQAVGISDPVEGSTGLVANTEARSRICDHGYKTIVEAEAMCRMPTPNSLRPEDRLPDH